MCRHNDKDAIKINCILPDADPNAVTVPVDVPRTGPESLIGGPRLGGTHKGFNGANQILYSTSLKCT